MPPPSPELVFFPVLGYNGIPSLCSRPLKYTCREVPHEKISAPPPALAGRRSAVPPGAPPAPPRLSGGRSAPAAPAQTAEEADFFVHLTLSLHPAPCLNSPGGPDTGAGDPGLYGPALPRSPGAARAGVLSHRLAGEGAAGHLHHPRPLRGRRTSARSPSRGRTAPAPAGSCPPPKSGPWTAFGARSWTMKRPRPNRSAPPSRPPRRGSAARSGGQTPPSPGRWSACSSGTFRTPPSGCQEWLAYQSQGTLDQWYDLERARALSLTGRDGAVFRFSLIPYHENAYHVLALAGEGRAGDPPPGPSAQRHP